MSPVRSLPPPGAFPVNRRSNSSESSPADDAFSPPAYRIDIPDGLGRPPNSKDVTILEGFDGRTPDEAVELMRGNHTGAVHPNREKWLHQALKDMHKAFTLHLSNVFMPKSPHQQVLAPFIDNAEISVLALASLEHPHALRVTPHDGSPPRFFTVGDFGFEEQSSLPYQTLIEADVKLNRSTKPPAGELAPLRYKKWDVPGLAEVGSIEEL